MTFDLRDLVRDAASAATEAGVAYAIIGGCARNAYAEPRATKDVDLVADASPEGYERLRAALAARGFQRASAVDHGPEPVPDAVFYRDAIGRRIDVLFAHTTFERDALASARPLAVAGAEVPVVGPEMLVVYKLIAGRTQDVADVEAVVRTLRAGGRAIDWSVVERWCAEWEVLDRLRAVRASLGV